MGRPERWPAWPAAALLRPVAGAHTKRWQDSDHSLAPAGRQVRYAEADPCAGWAGLHSMEEAADGPWPALRGTVGMLSSLKGTATLAERLATPGNSAATRSQCQGRQDTREEWPQSSQQGTAAATEAAPHLHCRQTRETKSPSVRGLLMLVQDCVMWGPLWSVRPAAVAAMDAAMVPATASPGITV